jgi:hypothetical protein
VRPVTGLLKLGLGITLAPSAAILLWSALRALWGLSSSGPVVYPFLSGFALPLLLRLFVAPRGSPLGRFVMGIYVFGHELTHALATWMEGGKVFAFKAGPDGGHVDVSSVSTFASLAPYCLPLYSLLVVLGWRAWVWARPGTGGLPTFLFLRGLTLSFHALTTFECLWAQNQPDLDAAGGVVFSLSLIILANGLVLLLMLKVLFPGLVGVRAAIERALAQTSAFWGWCGRTAVSGWQGLAAGKAAGS